MLVRLTKVYHYKAFFFLSHIKYEQVFVVLLIPNFFLIYKMMSNVPVRFYLKNNERLQKKTSEKHQDFSEYEKK